MTSYQRIGLAFLLAGLLLSRQSSFAQEGDSVTVKLLFMQNASVEEMALIINSLYADPELKIAIDPRTNVVIARGPAPLLEEIEAIMLKLDSSAGQDAASSADPKAATSTTTQGVVVNNPVEGTSAIRYVVNEGAVVKKDDLLVEFSDAHIVKDIDRIRLQLEHMTMSAKTLTNRVEGAAQIAENELHVRLAELRLAHGIAELKLDAGRVASEIEGLRQTMKDIKRFIEVLTRRKSASKDYSAKDMLEATIMLREHQQKLGILEQSLVLFEKQTRPLRRSELEAQLVHAQAQLKEAHFQFEQAKLERQADADAVDAQLEMLRDQHRRLEEQRATLKVLAPVDGVVHHVMDPAAPITVGSTVRGGRALVSISPLP